MGGPLEYSEIISACPQYEHYREIEYFVETGTYKGDTVISLSNHFKELYTMEIVPELFNSSKNRADKAGIENIRFLQGDSVQLLSNLPEHINKGAVFFLDAHQSGQDTSNNGMHVPLLEELDVILRRNLDPSLFVFDDTRFWKNHEKSAWDWEQVCIGTILTKFLNAGFGIYSAFEKNDRFFVLTTHKNKNLGIKKNGN